MDTRHKETDLVREDIERAAKGQGASMEDTTRNLERSLGKIRSGSGRMASTGSSSPTR
ncbi:MAG: hypothetical protein ACLGIJ_06960 [Candidatus Limnocylindria bacterium]